LGEYGLTALSLSDLDVRDTVEEDGNTFTENAIKKATYYLRPGNEYAVLADDSGLEIDALQKQPGVYSARFLGESTPYMEKNQKILAMLSDVPEEKRTARFVCVIACAYPDGRVWTTQGTIEGLIAYEPKGENGFGYDPIFYLPAYGLTMAQLTNEDKNRISHRGQALKAMCQKIYKW